MSIPLKIYYICQHSRRQMNNILKLKAHLTLATLENEYITNTNRYLVRDIGFASGDICTVKT